MRLPAAGIVWLPVHVWIVALLIALAGPAAAGGPAPAAPAAPPELVGTAAVDEVGPDARPDALGNPTHLRAMLPLHPGDPYSADTLAAAAGSIRAMFDAAGYALARVIWVTGSLDDGTHQVDVEIRIRRGPRCHVAAIAIAGTDPVTAARLRRTLGFVVGDRYTGQAGTAARDALATALARPVELDADARDPDHPGALTVTFTVKGP